MENKIKSVYLMLLSSMFDYNKSIYMKHKFNNSIKALGIIKFNDER